MTTKKCPKCKTEKLTEEFAWYNKAKNYRQSWCRPCMRIHWVVLAKTPKRKASKAAYKKTLRGKAVRAIYKKTPQYKAMQATYNKSLKGKATRATWVKNNRGKINATNKKRKIAQLQRIPKWADLEAIKCFYVKCPKGCVVDHVVPLRGKLVSGLHVLNNLQYLTPNENDAKKNKFNPIEFNRTQRYKRGTT